MQKLSLISLISCFSFLMNVYPQNAKIDSLLQQLNQVKSEEEALIYNQLSKLYYYENPQQTIDYGIKAYEIGQNLENKQELFYALIHIGVGYSLLGYIHEPIKYHLQAQEIAEMLNEEDKLATVYNELGLDYKNDGNFEKAINFFLKALVVKEAITLKNDTYKNKKSLRIALNNIGVVHDLMGNFDKALEYYQKALKIAQEIGDQKGLASILHNIGVVYEERGEFHKSLEYYQQSLAIKEELDSERSIAGTIVNIGIIYLDLGEYEKALEYHRRALKTYQEINDQRNESNLLNSLADIYLAMKEPAKAYPHIIEAIRIAKEIGSKRDLVNSYKFLAAYYAAVGKYKNAFDVQQDLLNLKDSLFTTEMTENIAEMQTRYETEKKEQEIHLLTKEHEIKNLKIRKQSTQLYFLLVFTLFAGIVSYLFFSRYKLKQKQRQSKLEMKSLETEHRMLRSQMNPHFIFNSMNSIQSFISGNDNLTAMSFLSKFARLMRFILENSRKSLISLEDEIETLQLYVELEKIRFKHKFDFLLEVDPNLIPETIFVPPMLVQPMVENAIKHGLRNKEDKGLLKLSFMKINNVIQCTVHDNGIGRAKASKLKEKNQKDHNSLGMQVTLERLEMLTQKMNDSVGLEIIDLKDEEGKPEGTQVNITIPFEEE